MINLLTVTEDQNEQIEALAQRRGYLDATSYLLALVQADVLIDALGDDLDDAEPEGMDLRESIRESWHEAMTGRIRPISELWDEI